MQSYINKTIKTLIELGIYIIAFMPLVVANSMYFPFITGKGFFFRILVEIVFTLWFILVLRERGTSVVNTENSVIPKVNWLTISVTVFCFIALIADIFGINFDKSFWSNFERMEGWLTIVHGWAYFIVLTSVLNTKDKWLRFLNIAMIAGLITAIYGFIQFLGLAPTHQGAGRVDASIGNSEYMAAYMLFNAFFAGYVAIKNFSKRNWFIVYSVLFAFFSFVLFQTATRGTILAWIISIFISCIVYLIFARRSTGQSDLSRILASGVVICFILIVSLFIKFKDANWIKNNQVLGRLATISISDTKTQARAYIWPMAIKGTFETTRTSLIGVGQENFNYIFNSHYNPLMYKHEQWFDRAHNVYLDWLVAGGLIGLISYLFIYLFVLFYIYKSDQTIGEKTVLFGLISAYAMHNVFVFDNQVSYLMFFIFLAFIVFLKSGNVPKIFNNYRNEISEDSRTIIDYVYVPVLTVLGLFALFFINIQPARANLSLIDALQNCSNPKFSTEFFDKVFKLNQKMANQESIESFYGCTASIINNQRVPENNKVQFYNLARTLTDKQIAETPTDARIYIIAGSFYDNIGDYRTATPLLEKANQLSPNKQTIMYVLGSNYITIGKKTEGVKIMEDAYNLAKDNDDAKQIYATALVTSNRDMDARKLYQDNINGFYSQRIAAAYMSIKQYDKAIETYKSLIKVEPNNQDLYSKLAYVYIQNHQNYLAIDTLNTMSKNFPTDKKQIDDLIKQINEGKIKADN